MDLELKGLLGEVKEAEKCFGKLSKNGSSNFEEKKYYKMYIEGKLKYLKDKTQEAKN